MCRILVRPDGCTTPFIKKELEQHYKSNPHGTGLYYLDKTLHKPVVLKWVEKTDFDTIWKTVDRLQKRKNVGLMAIHFRFATSLCKTIEQVHPVKVANNFYLMHNGFCNNFNVDPEHVSDTQVMGWWFKQLGLTFSDCKEPGAVKFLSSKFFGNKLVLLSDNDYQIINDHLGEWKNGIWQSWKDHQSYLPFYDDYDDDPEEKYVGINDQNQLRLF